MRDFLNSLEIISNAEITLADPETLKISDVKSRMYLFNREVETFIYKNLDFTKTASKKVYAADIDIWNSLISVLLDNTDFDFNNYTYIKYSKDLMIVSCTDQTKETIETSLFRIKNELNEFNIESNMNDFGVIRTILTKDNDDTLLFVNLDIKNSQYNLYSGKYINDKIILHNIPTYSTSNLYEFLFGVPLTIEYKVAQSLDIPDIDWKMTLSARELMDILKDISADISIDDDTNMVTSVSGMDSIDSKLLTEHINSFNMPYKSLKSLNYIRKCLKISDFTFESIIEILSKEIFEPNLNITGSTIASLCNKAFNDDSDLNDLKLEGLR